MASPAVDLPDPLNGGKLAGVANADDLLSQLAGDEIDRLLAESESDAAPKPMPAVPIAPAAVPTPAAVIAPLAPLAPAPVPVEAALDAVLSETNAPDDTLTSAPSLHDGPTDADEKLVLPADDAPPLDLLSDHTPATAPTSRPHTPRAGLLVKPLLWINAPVAGISESGRELMGKLGLVTLINAVAVLAYMWLFGRHHR